MTTEAKVGAFVLTCSAVLAFAVVYLLNAQFRSGTLPFRTYLQYAGGLQAGSPGPVRRHQCGRSQGRPALVVRPHPYRDSVRGDQGTPLNENLLPSWASSAS